MRDTGQWIAVDDGLVPKSSAQTRGSMHPMSASGLKIRNRGKTLAGTCALAGTLVLLLCSASPGLAAGDGEAPSEAARWVGRYCTTRACADAKSSPLSHAAGFGFAVFGALWLAGRSSAKN